MPPAGPAEPSDRSSVASPRRTLPVERLGALIEVVLCSGLPTQLLVFGALTGLGMASHGPEGGWAARFVITMSLVDMALVLALVYVFLRAHDERVGEFLLADRPALREALLGVVLIPATFVVVVVVLAVVLTINPDLQNVPVNPFERMLQTPRDAAIFAVVATFAGGVREEIQRGFIVRRFDQYLGGGLIGVLLYSGVFGIGHVDQGYAAAIATGVLGAGWGLLYLARRSVVAPIVSHAGFNILQLVKYAAVADLLR